jgi:hypothetical protein
MKPINVETLMGHSTGISDSYYRPTETELLQDYFKVVEQLTISSETRLKSEVAEINNLKEQETLNADALASVSDQVLKLMLEVQQLKEKQK